jgi:hypothetical protein
MTEEDKTGVSCDLCHRLVDPLFEAGISPPEDDGILAALRLAPMEFGNGMYVVDPTGARRGPFVDAASGHPIVVSPFHQEAGLCGTCHDVSNPAFEYDGQGNYVANAFDEMAGDFSPGHLMPIERTYSEWLHSEYNTPAGVYAPQFGGNLDFVATCQDCHMRDVTGQGCNLSPPVRADLPLHDLTGGSTWVPSLLSGLYPGEVNDAALQAGIQRARYMLQHAATLDAVQIASNLNVTVTNETGHKLPTGYPEGRRMWLNVKFYDDTMTLIEESGAYDPATGVLAPDPQIKVYEAKPGLDTDVAADTGKAAGPSFHFVLNNRIYKDNRIPPRGFSNAAFESFGGSPVGYSYADGQYWDDTSYLIPANAVTAEVTLYYQSTSKEYIEFLRDENHTDSTGTRMYNLWNDNGKCPPEVMATTVVPLADCVVDADCDDQVPCTDDVCQPGVGCQHLDNCIGTFACDVFSGSCQMLPAEPPTIEGVGARYLAITPPSEAESVAIRIEQAGIPCLPRYVDANGYLVDTPVFQGAAAWGTIHVADRAIVPSTEYDVRADVRLESESENLSAAVSGTTWAWGDTNNDDDVNLFDIVNVLDGFQNVFLQATPYSTDFRGDVPDRLIDIFDIIAVLDAFQDLPYAADTCASQGLVASGVERSARVLHVVPHRDTVRGGGVLPVDVFLSGGSELRGYELELHAEVEPGATSGIRTTGVRLEFVSIQSDREDYVFFDRTHYPAVAEATGRLANAALATSPVTSEHAYLGTWVFSVSSRIGRETRLIIEPAGDALLALSSTRHVGPIDSMPAVVRLLPEAKDPAGGNHTRQGLR